MSTTLKPSATTTTLKPATTKTTLKPCPVENRLPKTLKPNQVTIKISNDKNFFFNTASKWEPGICSKTDKKPKDLNQCIIENSINEALVELKQFYFNDSFTKDRKGFVLNYKKTTDDKTKLVNYNITNPNGDPIEINYYCGSVIVLLTVANEYTAKKIKENEGFLANRILHFYNYKKYTSDEKKNYYSVVINQIFDKTRNAYAPCPGENDYCPKYDGIPLQHNFHSEYAELDTLYK